MSACLQPLGHIASPPARAHARGGVRATRAALSFSFVGAAALLCTQRQRRLDRRIHRSRNACLQTCLPVCRLSLAFHTAAVKALAWAPLKVRKQHWSQKSVADMCWLAKTPFKGTDNAKKGTSSCAYGICARWRSPGLISMRNRFRPINRRRFAGRLARKRRRHSGPPDSLLEHGALSPLCAKRPLGAGLPWLGAGLALAWRWLGAGAGLALAWRWRWLGRRRHPGGPPAYQRVRCSGLRKWDCASGTAQVGLRKWDRRSGLRRLESRPFRLLR